MHALEITVERRSAVDCIASILVPLKDFDFEMLQLRGGPKITEFDRTISMASSG